MEIKRKCERKINKKKVTLVQKTLMSAKGRIKKSKHKSSRVEIERRRLITSHIEKEIREGRSRKIKNNIEKLRQDGGGVKEDTFWEFRKRMKGKRQ